MLFGQLNSVAVTDGWQWDGVGWSQLTSLPPPRGGGALVWDAGRQRLVLFGGAQANGPRLQDTWEWDGSQWAARTPASSPTPRSGHGLAYDQARGVVLMFGGYTGSAVLNDTWQWNGSQWLLLSPGTRPTPRDGAMMAFDPVGNGVLLYGGGLTDETWFWNGSTWQLRTPSTPPYIRTPPGMVTDLHRRRIVLFGGDSTDAATWEWDGVDWHSLSLPGPGPRLNLMLAYDPLRRETVLFGGDLNLAGTVNDTWVYRTDQPATVTAFGAGCPGSHGVPMLTNDQFLLPWIGTTTRMVASNLAASTAAVIFASGTTANPPIDLSSYGMPGCSALVAPMATDFSVASAGAATWAAAIPNSMSLVGVHVAQQAFVLEPGANAAGVVVSNGADLLVGVR
jgi:hypothetical protein